MALRGREYDNYDTIEDFIAVTRTVGGLKLATGIITSCQHEVSLSTSAPGHGHIIAAIERGITRESRKVGIILLLFLADKKFIATKTRALRLIINELNF